MGRYCCILDVHYCKGLFQNILSLLLGLMQQWHLLCPSVCDIWESYQRWWDSKKAGGTTHSPGGNLCNGKLLCLAFRHFVFLLIGWFIGLSRHANHCWTLFCAWIFSWAYLISVFSGPVPAHGQLWWLIRDLTFNQQTCFLSFFFGKSNDRLLFKWNFMLLKKIIINTLPC